jgi:ribosome-binding factor A
MRLKHTPDITFHFDPSIEYAIHIAEVIQQLHREEGEDENGD